MEDNNEKDSVFDAKGFSKLSSIRKVDRFEDIQEKVSKNRRVRRSLDSTSGHVPLGGEI